MSVCLAAYQVAPYIAEAVSSVLAQTHPAHEIVVCDDGSTDDLAGALAPFGDRVTVVRQENQGLAAARNTAIAATTGEFVVVLDPDDRYLPDRLARLAELAGRRPDLDVLTTDALIEFEGTVIGRYYTESNRFVVDDQRLGIVQANFVFGLAAVRRAALDAVGGYDRGAVLEDWDLWARLILNGSSVGLVAEPLAVYRLRAGSLSSARRHLLRGRAELLSGLLERPDLTEAERAAATAARSFVGRMQLVAEAQAALLDGAPDARARLLQVVTARGMSPAARAKAAVSALAPRRSAAFLNRRAQQRRYDPAAVRAERE